MHLRRFLVFFLPLLLGLLATGCSSLPRDVAGRRAVYQQRLARLEFPVTRERLYKALRPVSSPRPEERFSLLSARETYRVDADFLVEISVLYKAVTSPTEFLNPSASLTHQIRSLMSTTQSMGVMLQTGTPNHPEDIVQSARLIHSPLHGQGGAAY